MVFAVVEEANRPFEDLYAQLRDEPVMALRTALAGTATQLWAETGPLVAVRRDLAVRHVRWRDKAGCSRLDAEIRLVGVNRGAEPVTELLMMARGPATEPDRAAVVAWAHDLLAQLADPRPARSDAKDFSSC